MHMQDQQLLCEITEMDEKKWPSELESCSLYNIIMYKGVMSHSNNIWKNQGGKLLLIAQKDKRFIGNSHINFFYESIKIKYLGK